jgi:hypothetical protein
MGHCAVASSQLKKLRPVITTFLLDFQAEWPDQPKGIASCPVI